MPAELTFLKAIEKVLNDAKGAMHYQKITEKIIHDGLKSNYGATPERSVFAAAITAIKNDGKGCPIVKVGKGLFAMRKYAGTAVVEDDALAQEQGKDDEVQYDVITSCGMFWARSEINWTGTPKILGIHKALGMKGNGAKAVDFHGQFGIYLLYDGREVIYVGRATDGPLGKRLYEHTVGRLSSRWDRFSWFGLLPVSEHGALGTLPESFMGRKLIPAFEAVMIEALEPRQNRKRGDDLEAVEYIQKIDPEIQMKKIMKSMEDMRAKFEIK